MYISTSYLKSFRKIKRTYEKKDCMKRGVKRLFCIASVFAFYPLPTTFMSKLKLLIPVILSLTLKVRVT
jgi:hypothetical protein